MSGTRFVCRAFLFSALTIARLAIFSDLRSCPVGLLYVNNVPESFFCLQMADAGFYMVENEEEEDLARCFYCRRELSGMVNKSFFLDHSKMDDYHTYF